MLAYKVAAGSALPRPAGLRRVTAAIQRSGEQVLEVYVAPETTLTLHSDAQADRHTYLWGLAGHPETARSESARWIAEQVAGGDANRLRQLVGSFVALIDERASGSVHIVSDVGGTRPFFSGSGNGALVCGSDAWTMAELGWIGKRINLDAVAAWVRAAYDFTEGSLFTDLSLVEPGAVSTFQGDQARVNSYVQFEGGYHKPALDDLLDNIHGIMTRSFQSATRELGKVQIALSGGFDSRYLAALAMSHGLDVRAVCLRDKPSEGIVAEEVARRLGLPLQFVETDGSRWNAYPEPFHFSPSGFPITKQQTYPAALRNPGMPCLNGFMGDGMIRGQMDRLEKKLPAETTEDHANVFQRAQNLKHTFARFDLVEPELLRRCDARTLPACRKHIARYAHTANVFAATMYLRRHRTYFGNNFVQHLAFAEPILPFVNYDLFQLKCRTDSSCFKPETYEALFKRFYPKLGDIPHNEKLPNGKEPPARRSVATPRWAREVLAAMLLRGAVKILNPGKTIPRLIAALRGGDNADVVAMFAYRLYLLERRLRTIDVELDWDGV